MAETKKRETAAERVARQRAEQAVRQQAEWAEFTEKYPVRFANLLFKYMELDHANFRVKKMNDEVYSFFREDYSYRSYELNVTPPVNYDWEYVSFMDHAESYLEDYAREVAEAERKYRVKQVALAKLSEEEKELLGL